MATHRESARQTPDVISELCRTVQRLADERSIDTPLIDEYLSADTGVSAEKEGGD